MNKKRILVLSSFAALVLLAVASIFGWMLLKDSYLLPFFSEQNSEKLLEDLDPSLFHPGDPAPHPPKTVTVKKDSGEKTNLEKSNEKQAKPAKQHSSVTTKVSPQEIPDTLRKPAKPLPRYIFTTGLLPCPLKEEPMLLLWVQVVLKYAKKDLEEEIKFKARDIEAIIQNIVYKSDKEDLTAPYLRKEFLNVLNEYLQEGDILDLEFKDLKIEIRNSDH